ncbi:hypothetical protein [Pyruvatibacter sp.]|uniref:hypothetical protein n=1 Tax=Pyruvatibacter sp. TaxID=1981328 RepID=UPI0032EDB63A
MSKTILVAGGYGVVGTHIARQLRHLMPDAHLIIAGRSPEKAAPLVTELGSAKSLAMDTASPADALTKAGPIDAIVAALQDPHDKLLQFALTNGIAHLSITRAVTEMAGLLATAAHTGLRAPLVPAAHWQAGILSVTALDFANQFQSVHRISMSALFDLADPIGPMTIEDAGHFFGKALIVRDNQWTWIEPDAEAKQITIGTQTFDAKPMSVLDVTSLRAATGAANIGFYLGMGTSSGTRDAGAASHDMLIEIEGTDASGTTTTRTRLVSDPQGQAHLTATGAALATRRAIGGDGKPAPAPAIHMPETILDVRATTALLQSEFGIKVTDTP